MSPELDKQLVEKYPLIFANRFGSPHQTGMCWGFECGDGWYDLIDTLCASIQNRCNVAAIPQVIATQVKEKFGGLRFYFTGGDYFIDGMVEVVEELSTKICDTCGDRGKCITDQGWWYTACEKHIK